jgi:hypothetical protein
MARSENLRPYPPSPVEQFNVKIYPVSRKQKTPETNPIPRMRLIIGFRDHELEDEVPNEKLTLLIVDTINCRS